MHDADGRIDRDFRLLGPRLAEKNFIIIDDVTDVRNFRPISDRYPFGGVKNLITWNLLAYLTELGLFEEHMRSGPIVFGAAPQGADFSRIDTAKCEDIVDGVMREHAAATA